MDRFKQIDILRAVAVVIVLGRHMTPCPPETSALFHSVTRTWAQGGWVGVDLFFVLSGFLVSGLLFREHEKHRNLRIGYFLIRRGLKIYPSFWLLIGATFLVRILRQKEPNYSGLAVELLFVQNYWVGLWGHTWSLAVEEHFYLLLASLLFVLAKRRYVNPFGLIPSIFFLTAILCLAFRILTVSHFSYNHWTHLFPTHLRLDALFFGVFLSYLFHSNPIRFVSFARRFRFLLICVGIVFLLPAFCFPLETTPFILTYGLTLFYLAGGCLLVSAIGFQSPSNQVGSAIAYIGSHSYSVYLWHVPLELIVATLISSVLSAEYGWFAYAVTYLIGVIVFGIAVSKIVEFPILRFRDRFLPSREIPLSFETRRKHS